MLTTALVAASGALFVGTSLDIESQYDDAGFVSFDDLPGDVVAAPDDADEVDESMDAADETVETTVAALEDVLLRVAGNSGNGIHEEYPFLVEAGSFEQLNVLVTLDDPGKLIKEAIACVEAIIKDATGEVVARATYSSSPGIMTQDETVTVLDFDFAESGIEFTEDMIGEWILEFHAADNNLDYALNADVLY